MSDDDGTFQEVLWHDVHAAHRDREYVRVTLPEVHVTGRVTAITNEDFTIAGLHPVRFDQVEAFKRNVSAP